MNKFLAGAISGLLLSPAALAEVPAVYQDGVISIAGGAVIDAAGGAYYHNIEMLNVGAGNFRIVAAERAQLATVESVLIMVDVEADTAEVTVEGTKPTPCYEVLEPAMRRIDNELIVVLPLSEPTAEACAQVITPFQVSFELNLAGLPAGMYTVVVNGVEEEVLLN